MEDSEGVPESLAVTVMTYRGLSSRSSPSFVETSPDTGSILNFSCELVSIEYVILALSPSSSSVAVTVTIGPERIVEVKQISGFQSITST